MRFERQPSDPRTGSGKGRRVRLWWVGVPAAGAFGGLLAAVGVLDTAGAEVLLAVAVALLVVAGLALGLYACKVPGRWLLHLTSEEAAAAMAAGPPPGVVHMVASGGRGRAAPLFGAANPWRRRLCFFSAGPSTRWQRFNLPPAQRSVAVWVRPDDLAVSTGTGFYRRRLDGGVAFAADGYLGPAVIETGPVDTAGGGFSPRTAHS